MVDNVAYAETDEYDNLPVVLEDFIESDNLIDVLEAVGGVDNRPTREEMASDIQTGHDTDLNSMHKWKKKYDRALKLAQLQPDMERKTFPFNGASRAMMPFILEAMIDFNSRTAPELVFAKNVLYVRMYGRPTQDKDDRAKRVATYSNYQLNEAIDGWRCNQDKLLMTIPCVGTAYKKTYYDHIEDEVRSDLVLADQVIFNHECASFEEAKNHYQPREFDRNELISFIRSPQDWDISINDDLDDEDKKDNYEFIEAHCWYDLDGDGYKEPYMFMYWPEKSRIVHMVADYEEEDILLNDDDEVVKIERHDIFTQYQFIPDPEGGPMGLGWGILMGNVYGDQH